MTQLRWPLQPLLDAGITPQQLRHRLGGNGYKNALVNGINDEQADEIAIHHGHHPANIWPNWAEAALTHLDQQYLTGGWRPAWLHNEAQRDLGEAA